MPNAEGKTQHQVILEMLKESPEGITPLDAIYKGITRLSAVIYDLRKAGFNIQSEIISVKSRWGTAHVARYKLV